MEFFINMELTNGDKLWALHTAQLVYWNHQVLCADSLHWMTSYFLDRSEICKMDGIIKILKLLQFLAFVMPIYTIQQIWNLCMIIIY